MDRALLADRARAACTWVLHQYAVELIPLALVGAVVSTGHQLPGWLTVTAFPLFLLLVAANVVGRRIHRKLDWAGVPCRWCDLRAVHQDHDQADRDWPGGTGW
ncbi:hypothetical protein ACFY2K_42915 [Kitasatospora sp. NPDC001309]|uniref:hypothetical protein n=1 Tax=Kitasatospora sp. NPDC001309 TaxID=3364013 RepID=UPI0036CDA74B